MSEERNPDLIVAIMPDELSPPGKLPFSIVHALNCAGITTYSQLLSYSPEAIMLIPGMTRAAVARIEAELNRRNLTLGPQQAVAPFNPTMPSPEPNPAQTPPAPNGGWHAGLAAKMPTVSATAPKTTAQDAMKAAMKAAMSIYPISATSRAPEQACTLRDRFAMAALTGMMSNLDRPDLLKGGYREVNIHEACVDAYALADGMLKARTKGQSGGAR